MAHHKEPAQSKLEAVRKQFTLSEGILATITKSFLHEAAEGLSNTDKSMAMIPTFVELIPNGSETGSFLAIDLGGTNLRVSAVTFHGDKKFTPKAEKYEVNDELKNGEATKLFDHIAKSVREFLSETQLSFVTMPPSPAPLISNSAIIGDNPDSCKAPIAFTFSFPVDQTALDSGTLRSWTKGYDVKNAVGKDVVKLLQDAFDRNNVHVQCVALLNDTVGTLLTRAYTAGSCILGAIFGTGTNGAYVEKVSNITKLGDERKDDAHMVVNTEWGAFDNERAIIPSTQYDDKLDKETINAGKQAFEKFISGMYLGEIARNVIIDFIAASLLFNGHSTPTLNKQWGVDTAMLSHIENAWLGKSASDQASESTESDTDRLDRVLYVIVRHFGLEYADVSRADADIVRQICGLVATRAAHLSACAIVAILVQTRRARLTGSDDDSGTLQDEGEKVHVGVDGSLIEYYPHFMATIRETMRKLVNPEVEGRVEIAMTKDGSGTGAALCAMVARQQNIRRFRK